MSDAVKQLREQFAESNLSTVSVTMKTTAKGSRTGAVVEVFSEGESYDLPVDLAVLFIGEGRAVQANARRKAGVALPGEK